MLAELTIEGVGSGIVGTAVIAFIIGAIVLQRLQEGRKALAEEIRRENVAADEPQSVKLQSPLAVTQHVEFTPITDHLRLVQDFRDHRESVDRRFIDMAAASSQGREKIYAAIRDQAKESAAIARETSSKVDGVSGQVSILNQQLQQISTTLIRK